jgi:hypothetical protein
LGNLAKVLAFIWRFDRINRPRIEAARISHAPEVPVRRLMNSSEIAVFLASVAEGAHRQSQTIPLPTLGLH